MDAEDDEQVIEELSEEESDSNENDSDDSYDGPLEEQSFDVSLAARHDYLGSDLEEFRSRTVHPVGTILWIPLLTQLGIVLLPDQTLPFTTFSEVNIATLREAIGNDGMVGVAYLPGASGMTCVGTIAEIFEYRDNQHEQFKIKAKGRQRFRILNIESRSTRNFYKVQILPEVNVSTPFTDARLTCLNKHRRNKDFKIKAGRHELACLPCPPFILKQCDYKELVRKIAKELMDLKYVNSESDVPTDPAKLAYWVAQCLPLLNTDRRLLLCLNSALELLQCVLSFLHLQHEYDGICCKTCFVKLSSRKHIFRMSADGATATYCNPGGHVHDLLTVSETNLEALAIDVEAPNLEFTWFPGYGWQVLYCRQCMLHKGWRFTAMEGHLTPRFFYGLVQSSVTMTRKRRLFNDEID